MTKIKIEICMLKAYNDKYICMIQYKCGKTELYAIIIMDVFNKVDNSTWIHMLKQIFERGNMEMHWSMNWQNIIHHKIL